MFSDSHPLGGLCDGQGGAGGGASYKALRLKPLLLSPWPLLLSPQGEKPCAQSQCNKATNYFEKSMAKPNCSLIHCKAWVKS